MSLNHKFAPCRADDWLKGDWVLWQGSAALARGQAGLDLGNGRKAQGSARGGGAAGDVGRRVWADAGTRETQGTREACQWHPGGGRGLGMAAMPSKSKSCIYARVHLCVVVAH